MKWFSENNMRLVSVGCFVAFVLAGAGNANADFAFGTPTNLGPLVNSTQYDAGPNISSDGLSLFFYSLRPGGLGGSGWDALDLWVATRETTADDWGIPVNLGSTINSSTPEGGPCISADSLSLFFDSWRPGGLGACDMWVTTRATSSDSWGTPVNLGPTVNSSALDMGTTISADGLELYFGSNRFGGSGDWDIWVTTRATTSHPWGTAENLGPTVNSSAYDGHPAISPDGLMLFITSQRPGGYGDWDIWVTARASRDGDWSETVNLGPMINSPAGEAEPSISPDGRWLYFNDYPNPRPGGIGEADLWKVPILPVVDLNGDGIVDAEDMCVVAEHWGEDYPLCDIGPMPWGDGVVDVEDLKILAEHLFEEVDDPTLIAHWKLDETEGMVVADGAGSNDGYALGDPVWLHDGGQVNGALQLDGVDDYVVTGAAPNPEVNSYSVLAWIKGGAPGQVVISQMDKADWLCANPSAGTLMTELTIAAGRNGSSLGSEAIITEGNWHRIGFVWDGSYRRLYVDGVIVAEDAHDSLDISSNGLYFGTGKVMESETFFSGLIDDVRIYNRAINP